MDIKGYFIHINRPLLLSIVSDTFDKMRYRKVSKDSKFIYDNVLDFDMLKYLSKEIILLNPIENCIIRSRKCEWNTLDKSKSLFYSNEGCGLPIGNLTSQLFSNVYLNVLDQYMKRVLHCKHYGRYVDDFYVVSRNKKFLEKIIPLIEIFMENTLNLEIQKKKTIIVDYRCGVEFLGGFIKPYRTYLSNKTIKRVNKNLYHFQHYGTDKNINNMVNSYIGMFSHHNSNLIKKEIMDKTSKLMNYGKFLGFYEKFIDI